MLPNPNFDISIHALPACRYWIRQAGQLPDMEANQSMAVLQRTPDFVVVNSSDKKRVSQLILVDCFSLKGQFNGNFVFTKHRFIFKNE